MEDLKQQGIRSFFGSYPKLFHLFVLIGITVTHLPFLKFLLYLTPILIVLMAFAWSKVAQALAGNWAGVLTFFVLLFVSEQPHQTLGDGGFPNFIAAGILLPFFLLAVARLVEERTLKTYAKALGWLLLIVFTHHISTFYAMVIILAFLVFYFRAKSTVPLLIALVVGVLFVLSPLGGGVLSLLELVFKTQHAFPWIVLNSMRNPNTVWGLRDYGVGISYYVVYGALLSFIPFFLFAIRKQSRTSVLAGMVLVLAVCLLIASQIRGLEFPVRLARDAALPLCIIVTCGTVWLLKFLSPFWWAQAFVLVVVALLMRVHFDDTLHRIFTYSDWMEYSGANNAAVQYVGSSPTGAVDQPIATIEKPDVHLISLTELTADNLSQEEATNLSQTSGMKYVFYQVLNGQADWERASILQAGFHQVAQFTDPLKTVYLFQR